MFGKCELNENFTKLAKFESPSEKNEFFEQNFKTLKMKYLEKVPVFLFSKRGTFAC